MSNEEKIQHLLEKYKSLVKRLNDLNDQMNEVGTDSEDMIPGHDDGAEWWAKMSKYQITLEQLRNLKEELRELGYRNAL